MKAKIILIAVVPALFLAACDDQGSKGNLVATEEIRRPLSVEEKVYKALECAMVSDAQIARLDNVYDANGKPVAAQSIEQFRGLAEQMKKNMAQYYEGLTQNYVVDENWLQADRDKIQQKLESIVDEFAQNPTAAARETADRKLQAMFNESCKYLVDNEGEELRTFLR